MFWTTALCALSEEPPGDIAQEPRGERTVARTAGGRKRYLELLERGNK